MVTAENLRTLVTHIFVAGGDFLASDAVFAVKDSLIKDFVRQPQAPQLPTGANSAIELGRGSISTSS